MFDWEIGKELNDYESEYPAKIDCTDIKIKELAYPYWSQIFFWHKLGGILIIPA